MQLSLPKPKESEKKTERYLISRVKEIGGKCLKFNSANEGGVPDRLCLFPSGYKLFVECKSEDKGLDPLQVVCFKEFYTLGHPVYVVYTKSDVDKFMEVANEYCRTGKEVEKHKQLVGQAKASSR